MAYFVIELGFDWNASLPTEETSYYLRHEVVAGGECAAWNDFNVGDWLSFVVYDTAGNQGLFLERVIFKFVPKTGLTAQSPFTNQSQSFEWVGPRPAPVVQTSVAYGGSCPAWPFGESLRQGESTTAGLYPLVNAGIFQVKGKVEISDGTTSKLYTFDPEMVVGDGSGGNVPGPEEGLGLRLGA